MKKCPYCGGQVSDAARACGYCGRWLVEGPPPPSSPAPAEAETPPARPPAMVRREPPMAPPPPARPAPLPRPKRHGFLAILALVLGLVMVLPAAWMAGRFVYVVLRNPRDYTGEILGLASAGFVGLVGLILIAFVARYAWREGRISPSASFGLLTGLVASVAAGSGLGWPVYDNFLSPLNYAGELLGLTSAGVVWLLGLVVSVVLAIRSRRK